MLIGFLGGVAAWFFILSVPGSNSIAFNFIKGDLVGFLGSTPAPTPTPIVSPDFWEKITSDHALSTVAVQSFKDGKVTKEGSGMIVSSDGLIVTTFDLIFGVDVIQVFYQDKILRGQLVKFDSFKNLALIKSGAADVDVARFDRNYQFQPGQDIIVSGKVIELLHSNAFAQRGMVSYILSKDVILNTEAKYFLSGSKVIDNSGVVIGMAYLRNGMVHLVKAEAVDDFIKSYFESI